MNLLDFYFPEWFFVALNLGIMILILKKIFWKPVNAILEERQEKAAKAEQEADEAGKLLNDMEQRRAQLDRDLEIRTAQALMEARTQAGHEYDRIVAEAETKANLILRAAKDEARQEQERAAAEMKKQLSSAAVEAAGFLLRANLDSESNRRLVEGFLSGKDVSA